MNNSKQKLSKSHFCEIKSRNQLNSNPRPRRIKLAIKVEKSLKTRKSVATHQLQYNFLYKLFPFSTSIRRKLRIGAFCLDFLNWIRYSNHTSPTVHYVQYSTVRGLKEEYKNEWITSDINHKR
jgi:hypothetical protein